MVGKREGMKKGEYGGWKMKIGIRYLWKGSNGKTFYTRFVYATGCHYGV